jgi:flagellar basal body-associated protein FliL
MRQRIIALALIACLSFALAFAANAAADQHTIPAGQSYTIEVELESGELFTYNWHSDVDLDFVVRDPSGLIVQSESDTDFDVDVLWPSTAGTYSLTWDNNGMVAASLTYELSGAISGVEKAFDWFLIGLIITAIIIAVVVVIVVVVVVMGGKKGAAQPPMGPPPQVASQAAATGHCPTCGTLLDPNAAFCPRCGTQYR